MPFKNGESGNPSGRPVGSENKLTRRAKYYANKLFDEFEKIGIDKMAETGDIKDLINLISKFIPKDMNIKHSGQIEIPPIQINIDGKIDTDNN